MPLFSLFAPSFPTASLFTTAFFSIATAMTSRFSSAASATLSLLPPPALVLLSPFTQILASYTFTTSSIFLPLQHLPLILSLSLLPHLTIPQYDSPYIGITSTVTTTLTSLQPPWPHSSQKHRHVPNAAPTRTTNQPINQPTPPLVDNCSLGRTIASAPISLPLFCLRRASSLAATGAL